MINEKTSREVDADPRVAVARDLFDAEAPSMKLGYGHAKGNLRYGLSMAVANNDPAWLDHVVDYWIKPAYRPGHREKLLRMAVSAGMKT